MQTFQHTTVTSVADTIAILSKHGEKATLMAGGTDLLGILKNRATVAYPQVVVNIKSIAGLDEIKADDQGLTLGALTRLADIVDSEAIGKAFPMLAEAAASVAMPQIRNVGTLGGNLAQETRCWYFRYPHAIGGRIMCKRKGDGPCLAVKGDNRYHAIFKGKKCFAVCPSDMAVALAAKALLPMWQVPWVGLGLIMGNHWPLFHGFRGGKGVANYLGFTIVVAPAWAGIGALAWGAAHLVWRTPFISSFAMVLCLAAGSALVQEAGFRGGLGALATALFIVACHHANIRGRWGGGQG